MTTRPTIAPEVLAAIISAAPERLQKKLDREPRIADTWSWERSGENWTIAAGEETVTLPGGPITAVSQVKCTCLLSPRCFHVLAVLNLAEFTPAADVSPDKAGEIGTVAEHSSSADEVPSEVSSRSASVAVTESQSKAAGLMFDACAALLNSGLRAAGAVLQSRLLRAIHECRAEGLHRLAAGGLRLMAQLRALRDNDDQFSSAEAELDFRDVLETCLRLRPGVSEVELEWMGIARRAYEPVQSLKLHGLFCEPILTRSGFAGVVTWLIAEDGWIGSMSDVQPGDASRIDQAWRSGVSLAGLSISHRDLSGKCLLISKATRSVDGRVGGGEGARAVTVAGQGWDAAPIVQRFQMPLVKQIQRVFQHQDHAELLRPAGTEMVFFQAEVLGYADKELIVKAVGSDCILRLAITLDDDRLEFRSSLKTLARAPGVVLRAIGRIDSKNAGRINVLAIAPGSNDAPERPVLLPSENGPAYSIGLEEIGRSCLSRAASHPVLLDFGDAESASLLADYDEALERWQRAILIGGRHAIPQGLVTSAVRDAARLKAGLRPTAAALLHSLTQSSVSTKTDLAGIRFSEDPAVLTEKWLAAAICTRSTTSHLQWQEWLRLIGHGVMS